MNERQKSLLVIQVHSHLRQEAQNRLFEAVKPTAKALGVELMISDASTSIQMHSEQGPLVDALTRQTEALERHTQVLTALVAAMAGEMISDPDVAAPVGLNGRPAL